jgi:hypothetical protein
VLSIAHARGAVLLAPGVQLGERSPAAQLEPALSDLLKRVLGRRRPVLAGALLYHRRIASFEQGLLREVARRARFTQRD